MANKKQKTENSIKPDSHQKKLTSSKKSIFWIITIMIPVLFILLLEAGLRIFNYGGNSDLFIKAPDGFEKYLRINPEVARRYFYLQKAVPTPPNQLFLKEKPAGGYRIFVLGESSAAGFPYGNNCSFPNILQRGLAHTFPDKSIEVINISMAAVNSYTMLDLTDEILEQKPDLILIYAGHNEYYGALGSGSTESLGNYRHLITAYLRLQSVKTVLLMRDIIGWIRLKINKLLYKGNETDPSATLMNRMVSEQIIISGSSLYEAGKEQFRNNIEEIIKKASAKGVSVILSELVSNLKDQEPFISIENGKSEPARVSFQKGREYELSGNYISARESYTAAKDNDALRFRAPEDFNLILAELSEKYTVPLVPLRSYFERESPNGLIGKSLMLEHLHPNAEGYFLIAKAFYDTMKKEKVNGSAWPEYEFSEKNLKCMTELDSVYASVVVKHLKSGWPFTRQPGPNRFIDNFHPQNKYEEISLKILPSRNYNLEAAHLDLGEYYEKTGQTGRALAEYEVLIASVPVEGRFYEKAATLLIMKKEYDKAYTLLKKLLRYRESSFAYKWLGQIGLFRKDYREAAEYLQKADPEDPQVLFNLSRTYYLDDQWHKGEEYYNRLKNLSPKSEYTAYLSSMRETIRTR